MWRIRETRVWAAASALWRLDAFGGASGEEC